MNSQYFISFVIFLVAILLSRMISTAATKKLTQDERHRVFDEFIPKSNLKFIFVAGVGIAYLSVLFFAPRFGMIGGVIFFGIIIIYLFVNFARTLGRLRKIEAPASYLGSLRLSWIVVILGFVILGLGNLFAWGGW